MKKTIIRALLLILLIVGLYVYLTKDKKSDQSNRLTLYGNVDIREVDLGFRVSGKLTEVFYDEGDRIKQGDLLASLDSKPYLDRVMKAKAEAGSAKLALLNAKKQWKRREIAKASSAVSEEDFENARMNFEENKMNVKATQAQLSLTRTDFEDCLCYSPSSGTILTRIREPGSILSAGDPVFTLSLDTPVWIRSYIDEPDLGKIYPGMKAEIMTDTPNHPIYHGHIGFISSLAEFTPKNVESPQLRTDLVFRLRIIVDDPDQGLRQGMPVTIHLLDKPEKIVDDRDEEVPQEMSVPVEILDKPEKEAS